MAYQGLWVPRGQPKKGSEDRKKTRKNSIHCSESLPLEWIGHIATEFTTLFEVNQEHWTSAKDEYVMGIARGSINLNQIFLDWLVILQFLTTSIPYTVENVADQKKLLI